MTEQPGRRFSALYRAVEGACALDDPYLLYNVDIEDQAMLAPLQELVMRSVRQLGPDCRANEVQETLTKLLGKEQAFGAIFTTLDRLTAKGFIKWEKGEPDNRRGGRAPRLYTITGDGIAALNEATRISYSMRELGPDLGAVPAPMKGAQ